MNHWIQTWSGARFDLADPSPSSVHANDIVVALSRINRFTGHTRIPYSVAEHSVRVARLVPERHRKAALLHDATEAYVQDIAAPLKSLLPDYRAVERRVWAAVAARFGIDSELPAEVKHADLVLLEIERRVLMGPPPEPWSLPVCEEEVDDFVRVLAGEDGDPYQNVENAWEWLRHDMGWAHPTAEKRLASALLRAGVAEALR